MAGVCLYGMNLPAIDEAYQVASMNTGQGNGLLQRQDLHLSAAPIAMADGPIPVVHVKRVGFVAFGRY